jgi:hypothetical protein
LELVEDGHRVTHVLGTENLRSLDRTF